VKIVCLTSNGYINCLQPFAYYWNRFTSDEEFGAYPVTVACYDVLPEGLPENFEVLSIGKQADYTWSAGLLRLLDQIEDDVILLMLEDYFLTEPVDSWKLTAIANYIGRFESVVKFDLTNDRLKSAHYNGGGIPGIDMIESAEDASFQTSLQAAFWRTSFLRRFAVPPENAWQFEKKGTYRVIAAREAETFDGVIMGTTDPPMQYANAVGGEGNHPGEITTKYMPVWMRDECVAKGWAK
jgi:hypothetical protein